MKKERTCWICEEYERRRLLAGQFGIRIEKERPIAFFCKCDPDTPRFLLFGPTPKTRREVDQLAKDLKRQLGLTKPPGPKAKPKAIPNLRQIDEQILKNEEWASLKEIAAQMGVKPGAIQERVKEFGTTFKKYQADLFKNSKKKIDKSRLSLHKLKKTRRMF